MNVSSIPTEPTLAPSLFVRHWLARRPPRPPQRAASLATQ
jgi:hypothetical protein